MSFCRKKSQSKEAIDHQKHEFSKNVAEVKTKSFYLPFADGGAL